MPPLHDAQRSVEERNPGFAHRTAFRGVGARPAVAGRVGHADAARTSAPAPQTVAADPLARRLGRLIVDDEASELEPGQIRRSEYLGRLENAVIEQAHEALAGTMWTPENCPWIAYWFGYYGGRTADHIERALLRYAPEAANASSAEQYIGAAAARIRLALDRLAVLGEVAGRPEDAPVALPLGLTWAEVMRAARERRGEFAARLGTMSAREVAENAAGAFEAAANEAAEANKAGAPEAPAEPGTQENAAGGEIEKLRLELGAGRPLEPGVRGRLEGAFGAPLPEVRLHDDAAGARIAARENARALAVGEHIAFASGQYRPGTPQGDGLLAHEMAHVLQQQGREREEEEGIAGPALERDAERSTVGVLARMWAGLRGGVGAMRERLGELGENALPTMKSGLALARCGGEHAPEEPKQLSIEERVEMYRNEANAMKPEDLRRKLNENPGLYQRYYKVEEEIRGRWWMDPFAATQLNEKSLSELNAIVQSAKYHDTQEYDAYIEVALEGFRDEAVKVAQEMVLQSRGRLLKERERYASDAAIKEIHSDIAFAREADSDRKIVRSQFHMNDGSSSQEMKQRLQVQRSAIERKERWHFEEAVQKHPFLKAYSDNLMLLEMSPSVEATKSMIRGKIEEMIQGGYTVAQKLESDRDLVWGLDAVLEKTKSRLGIQNDSNLSLMIDAKIERDSKLKQILDFAVLFATLVLGFISGGLSMVGRLVVAAVTVTTSAVQLANDYQEYAFGHAAANSDPDPEFVLATKDPSIMPLILDVIGIVGDVAAVRSVLKAIRGEARAVATSAKTEQEAQEALDELAKEYQDHVANSPHSERLRKDFDEMFGKMKEEEIASAKQASSRDLSAPTSSPNPMPSWKPGELLANLDPMKMAEVRRDIASRFGSINHRKSMLKLVVSRFNNLYIRVGRNQYLLTKSDLRHFLERHHPAYWNGEFKAKQSFFSPETTPDDIVSAIQNVINQNRDKLLSKSSMAYGQIQGEVDDLTYVIGFNQGHIAQCYALRTKP